MVIIATINMIKLTCCHAQKSTLNNHCNKHRTQSIKYKDLFIISVIWQYGYIYSHNSKMSI
uniref:Uncharacterized protein n=1 Tax=Tetranychus urticae TaxID=32264 RepID=T1JSR1_TETUR